jgi:hypothetical protein
MALGLQIPEDMKVDLDLIRISKHLNQGMATSYYNPTILKKMSLSEIDNLTLSVSLESVR